jgi:hypothetical protein
MPRKEFVAFTRLDASDVNSFLMDQTVMSFADAAARTTAIPTPVQGMTTYLQDIDDIRVYDGTKWIGPSGSTKIVNQSFTSTTQVIISNCFSADYDVYEIYVRTTAGGGAPTIQMRTGSTTATTGYGGSLIFWSGSGVTGINRGTSSFETFAGGSLDASAIKLLNPFNTRTTSYLNHSQQIGGLVGVESAFLNNTTSYESMVLNFSNSSTGNIAIYGLRK